jgi:N-acetylglucosaminyl-diphospho-decaprenol L-rhamnosyltransferase
MSDIDVAIAIVNYQSAALTIDCLRSIEPERLTPGIRIRAIVIDNASGDTPAIAEAIEANSWSPWVALLTAPRNGGFAYGNNLALQCAYEDRPPNYVHFLNPDTVVRKGAIGTLVHFLEAHPKAGVVGSSLENFDGTDWPFAFRFPSILSELESGLQFGLATRLLRRWVVQVHMNKLAEPIDWVSGASMMVRREVFDVIGGFDENYFLYFEETDFCLRAKRAGFETWYVPESRVMHILGQSTNVTARKPRPERLPAYWYESRRRYFAIAHGMYYAMVVDIVALLAHGLGTCKRLLQRRTNRGTPYFLVDLMQHSMLRSKNRQISQIRQFLPGSSSAVNKSTDAASSRSGGNSCNKREIYGTGYHSDVHEQIRPH